jgi:hypothetical protein
MLGKSKVTVNVPLLPPLQLTGVVAVVNVVTICAPIVIADVLVHPVTISLTVTS